MISFYCYVPGIDLFSKHRKYCIKVYGVENLFLHRIPEIWKNLESSAILSQKYTPEEINQLTITFDLLVPRNSDSTICYFTDNEVVEIDITRNYSHRINLFNIDSAEGEDFDGLKSLKPKLTIYLKW